MQWIQNYHPHAVVKSWTKQTHNSCRTIYKRQ